jgi:two-component system, cell cycle response regulator
VLAAGFDGYIDKPINAETFVQQLEAFLPHEPRRAAAVPLVRADSVSAPARSPCLHTILVVDNLPLNLELARSILQPFGYQVLTAENMNQALALATQHPCDLILSDVCMYHGTGFDFIRAVKADPWLRTVPFVFITSTMMNESDRAKGLALGAARYLFRPIEPTALLSEIRACLREAQRS